MAAALPAALLRERSAAAGLGAVSHVRAPPLLLMGGQHVHQPAGDVSCGGSALLPSRLPAVLPVVILRSFDLPTTIKVAFLCGRSVFCSDLFCWISISSGPASLSFSQRGGVTPAAVADQPQPAPLLLISQSCAITDVCAAAGGPGLHVHVESPPPELCSPSTLNSRRSR